MPTTTYEYLTVTYVHSRDMVTGKRNRSYQIWRPGATEPEERPATEQQITIFNQLGKEGWKMIASEFLRSTTIMAEGMDEVVHPIRIRWTFMKENEEEEKDEEEEQEQEDAG
jgi:hypothetical protein